MEEMWEREEEVPAPVEVGLTGLRGDQHLVSKVAMKMGYCTFPWASSGSLSSSCSNSASEISRANLRKRRHRAEAKSQAQANGGQPGVSGCRAVLDTPLMVRSVSQSPPWLQHTLVIDPSDSTEGTEGTGPHTDRSKVNPLYWVVIESRWTR